MRMDPVAPATGQDDNTTCPHCGACDYETNITDERPYFEAGAGSRDCVMRAAKRKRLTC